MIPAGTKVRVKPDATAWGDPDGPDSVHQGEEAIVRLEPNCVREQQLGLEGYDCWLTITSGRHAGFDGARFFFHELELA